MVVEHYRKGSGDLETQANSRRVKRMDRTNALWPIVTVRLASYSFLVGATVSQIQMKGRRSRRRERQCIDCDLKCLDDNESEGTISQTYNTTLRAKA